MKTRAFLLLLFIAAGVVVVSIATMSCAQVGFPTGGDKDTIPPKLVKANPAQLNTNFKGNKITLTFDEYIEVKELQNNVLVSPFPKNTPYIEYKLKTVTVKLKDSLLPNTTYSINFGNSIQDNNEGNPFKNFTYVFSTGNVIDSLELYGKVKMAESGKTDSTLLVLLYKSNSDTTVLTRKPDYISKLNGGGTFSFKNLAAGTYKIYALKDGDGGKTYNSIKEEFAFYSSDIVVSGNTDSIYLFAFAQEKDTRPNTSPKPVSTEKKFKYTSLISTNSQDLLTNLEINFNHPVKQFDAAKIIVTDTNFTTSPSFIATLDSSRRNLIVTNKWNPGADYFLIINKDGIIDSSNNQLAKSDTIRFKAKKESDYGNLLLHFKNIDLKKHPVLQFVKGTEVEKSVAITGATWNDKLFYPGEYELRILFDENNNGIWDPGNYKKKIQPEKALSLDTKLAIKANWDNERDIVL